MHAGHYWPRTAGLSLFFEEKNVHAQCPKCNYTQHSNSPPYALFLVQRYGDQILQELDWKRKSRIQIHDNEYLQLIDLYKKKILDLDKKF